MILPRAARLLLAASAIIAPAYAAQTYQDANVLNTWNAADANWDAGLLWENLLTSDAIFAGTGEAVAVTTVNARDITFDSTGYSLTGSTITLGATSVITANQNASIGSILAGAGTSLTKAGTGTLTLTGANSFTGQTIVSGGTLLSNWTGGTGTGTLYNTSSILVQNGGTLEFTGTANRNAVGAGNKSITVNTGGVLKISANNTMGYSAATNYANVTLAGGTFTLNALQYVNSLTLGTGSTVNGTGILQFYYSTATAITANDDVTISSGISLDNATNQNFFVASGKTLTVSGKLSGFNGGNGGATIGFTKTGTGTLLLSNNTNNFGGPTVVSAGTLKLGAAGALGTGANNAGTSVTAGAVLDLNGQTIGAEALTLNGSGIAATGALINSSGTAASHSGTVNLASATSIGGSGNLTLSGLISGANKLTKIGAGNLTVSNIGNSYSGGTTVSEGTLTVTSTGAIQVGSAAANVTVASGATLAINGRLELAASATLANSGTVTFTNGVIDLNGAFDSQADGSTYSLITGTMATGTASVVGYTPGTASFDAATGLITFTAIPEPASCGLLGAGSLALVAIRRRKRTVA